MGQNYRTDDGGLDWETIQTIVTDITGGYLRTVDGIDTSNTSRPYRTTGADPNVTGSRLLKILGMFNDISTDKTICDHDEDLCVFRMSMFAPIVLDLSKEYAREDETYLANFHGEVVKICEAAVTAKNTGGNESEGDEDDEYTVKSLPKLSDMKDPSDKFHYVDMQDLESSRSEPSLPHKPLMFGSLPDPYGPNFSAPDEAKEAIEAADVDADEIVRELEEGYDPDPEVENEVEKTVENILEEVRDFQKEYYQRHRRSIFGN